MNRRIIPGIFSIIFHFVFIVLILTIPSPEIKIKTPQTILAYLPKNFPPDVPLIYPSPKKDEQNKTKEKIEGKKEEEKEIKKDDRIFVRKGDVEAPIEDKQQEKPIATEPQKPEGEPEGEGTGKGSFEGKKEKNEIDSGLKFKDGDKDEQKKSNLRFPSGFSFEGGSSKGKGGGYPYQGFGASAYFDSGGYDITPWAREVIKIVKRNWFIPTAARYGIRGISTIYLVFERDGSISEFTIYKPSGIISFDQSAINALISSVPFPPLPYDLPKKNLPAYFVFYYNLYPEEK
ncbi:MAG: TonB C-terminal domain-containing protein [Acidobacteriota bacterium]